MPRGIRVGIAVMLWLRTVALSLTFALTGAAQPPLAFPVPLLRVSSDPLTNFDAQHATEVEPDVFAWGSTIVSVFQVGRYIDGGASAIGFATSTDSGRSWASGLLPGITQPENPSNPYARASDPTIVFDAKHGVWLANVIPVPPGFQNPAVIVSRSVDGLNWGGPIKIAPGPNGSDKNWITCDNTPRSQFYGHCYVEWDDGNFRIQMNTSTDGGQTWGPSRPGGNGALGLGGQPLVRPNGTVVVPFTDGSANELAIISKDGGTSWSDAIEIAPAAFHLVAAMRAPGIPSAAMDGAGKTYVAWPDCAFRAHCRSNDIVISTSADGMKWTRKQRVPIDARASSVDHFIAGIGVDRATSGPNAHLALAYSFLPSTNCDVMTCRLYQATITSFNGGKTWNNPVVLAGPMQIGWIADAGGGFVGDYVATTFTSDGLAHTVFAVGKPAPPSVAFDEGMYTTARGIAIEHDLIQRSSAGELPYPNAHSDHPYRHLPPRNIQRGANTLEKD